MKEYSAYVGLDVHKAQAQVREMLRDDPEFLDVALVALFHYDPRMVVRTIRIPDRMRGRAMRSTLPAVFDGVQAPTPERGEILHVTDGSLPV